MRSAAQWAPQERQRRTVHCPFWDREKIMVRISNHKRRFVLCAASAAVVAGIGAASPVMAAPYASGVSEAAGVVSFTLNHAATDVTVIRDGVPTSLGAPGKGAQSFNRHGAANYSIVLSNTET